MERREQLQTEYDRHLLEIPFNNFRRYLALDGGDKKLPKTLGGSCVFQDTQLAKQVRAEGFAVHYLQELGGLHTCLIITDPSSGARYYLDPFLLQREVINFDDVLISGDVKSSATYPLLKSQAQTHLELRRLHLGYFETTNFFDPYNPNAQVSYRFNLGELGTTHPKLTRERLKNGEDEAFILRLLEADGATKVLKWNFESRDFSIKRKGGSSAPSFKHEHRDKDGFKQEVEEICEHVKMSWGQLRALFPQAHEQMRAIRAS